jgi:hypothetical protein
MATKAKEKSKTKAEAVSKPAPSPSISPGSSSAPQSHGPSPLPPPEKRGRGRPKGSKTKTKTTGKAIEDFEPSGAVGNYRPLPEDPTERTRAIEEGRVLATPIILGLSSFFKAMGTSPLDPAEMRAGCDAGGMLAYQYGLYLDGRVCFALFIFGVSVPRVTELVLNWKSRTEKQRATVSDVNRQVREAKEVHGSATVTRVGA